MRHRFARFIIYAAARPAMAATAACGVWVLMAARRKQSGNNQSQSKSKSKSNCKSHASKYSAVAVYSGKQAKQLRQERQQTVCAVCCGSFKRVDDFCARIGTQQQQQANVQCATRNVPHAAGNGRRCGINQINGNCLKFALVYGLHGELASSVAANANCNGMSTQRCRCWSFAWVACNASCFPTFLLLIMSKQQQRTCFVFG